MVGPLLDRHVAEGRGGTPALRMAQRELSYGDLHKLVNRAGNALREAGIEPEQRVAIVVHDGPEFVAAFLGAMKIGAVPVPMNTAARRARTPHGIGGLAAGTCTRFICSRSMPGRRPIGRRFCWSTTMTSIGV